MVNDIQISIEPIMEFFPEEPLVEKRHGVVVRDTGTVRSMGTEVGDVRMAFTETGSVVNGSGRSTRFTIAWATHTGTFAVDGIITGSETDAAGEILSTNNSDPGALTGWHHIQGDTDVFDLVDGIASSPSFPGNGAIVKGQITSVTYAGVGPSVTGVGGGGSMRVDTGSVRAPYVEAGTVKAGS